MHTCPPSKTNPLSVEKQYSPTSSNPSRVMMGCPGGRSSRAKSDVELLAPPRGVSFFCIRNAAALPSAAPGNARLEKHNTTISRNLIHDARNASPAAQSSSLPPLRERSRKSRPSTPDIIRMTGKNSRSAPASSALPIRSAIYRRHGFSDADALNTPRLAAAASDEADENVPGARFGSDACTHRRSSSDRRAARI